MLIHIKCGLNFLLRQDPLLESQRSANEESLLSTHPSSSLLPIVPWIFLILLQSIGCTWFCVTKLLKILWPELQALALTTLEQHHSCPCLRSSSRLVIPVMVGTSNAEKPDGIAGWKQYKTRKGKKGGLLSGWSFSRRTIQSSRPCEQDHSDHCLRSSQQTVIPEMVWSRRREPHHSHQTNENCSQPFNC